MKYLTLMTLALAATTAQADFWDNCTAYGGTIITANSYGNDKGGLCNDPNNPELTNNCNGKRFCAYIKWMNWWSAFTWCEAIGGKLASFTNVCPGVQIMSNNTTGACPNAKGIGSNNFFWTNTGSGSGSAFLVNLSTGAIPAHNRNGSGTNGSYCNPLCEEK